MLSRTDQYGQILFTDVQELESLIALIQTRIKNILSHNYFYLMAF